MLNPSQLKQIEAVREKIAKAFYEHWLALKSYEEAYENDKNYCHQVAKQILSLPEIAILDSDQKPPRNKMSMASKLLYATAHEAQQDMLSAHFQRTIDKSEVK